MLFVLERLLGLQQDVPPTSSDQSELVQFVDQGERGLGGAPFDDLYQRYITPIEVTA